jgi:L-ribulose-5-phosphate 4-epimerase
MSPRDEGVIKYSCDWEIAPPLDLQLLQPLITWRDRLWQEGLIGVYPDGIGYGNISTKCPDGTFLITGSQTGHLPQTNPNHYTTVDAWHIAHNSLHCRGAIKASSESLTHAALYDYSPAIQAIVHIHNRQLWEHYQNILPTTAATVPYGTPQMAAEMWRLMKASDLLTQKILIMAGHEEGIITFGATLEEAVEILLSHRLDHKGKI